MTSKERMLAAIRGEPTDRLPWAPRLDLWFKANQRAGTLPDGFRDATLRDLCDALGMGYHAVVPDFRDLRGPEDDLDRALGLYNLRTMPCRTVLENVRRTWEVKGDRTRVRYGTPLGAIETVTLYDEAMRQAGISITHVEQHPFKGESDYAPLGYLFENARVVPQYEGLVAFAEYVGDRGVPTAYISAAASPMHLIQRELMPLDKFFYEMHDHPDAMRELARQVAVYWERLLAVACESPADVVLLGANYDATVTYPPFFREDIQPGLRRFADLLHARGKYLLTHTDGENTGLLGCYLDSGVDIADSICPAPMTKLTLREVRDAFAGRITILGGIPSVALLPSSMPDVAFERFLDRFFEDLGVGDHLILGISDTTPPAADFRRILAIGRRVEAFGAVRR
jgi:uroporphyrinogen-III decarboxylase